MFVTDTHPLVWYLQGNRKLSDRVLDVFKRTEQGQEAIYIPGAVIWEISLNLKAGGSIQLATDFGTFMRTLSHVRTFLEDPVTSEIINIGHGLNFSKDPFDSIIVATALARDLPLISNDSVIHASKPCELFW